jgi:hypothetical protein
LAPEEILERALTHLNAAITNRAAAKDFARDLDRALTVLDQVLRLVEGEAQDRSATPSVAESDEVWRTWLSYYEASVLNEWRRVGRQMSRATPPSQPPIHDRTPGEKRVFLSYARPDATSFAWPVHRLLEAAGARVWFDQRMQVEDEHLAIGFADAIAECDAFVLCATPELFERSGYAMQEIAWALQAAERAHPLKLIAVVGGTTLLPSRISHWPLLAFDRRDPSLAAELGRLLDTAVPEHTHAPAIAVAGVKPVPDLPSVADTALCLQRASHTERFRSMTNERFEALMNYRDTDMNIAASVSLFQSFSEGLGWSGHLSDIDGWPGDSAVRDMRFRMASRRALLGIRRLPKEDAEAQLVARDIEFLCKAKIPIFDWPVVPGWDDHSRNFALRSHLGILRMLDDILRRGVYYLAYARYEVVDTWRPHLRDRVVECLDFSLEQRLGGTLSWRDSPKEWDHFFVIWKDTLKTRQDWRGSPPTDALAVLAGRDREVAAAAADVVWVALRSRHSQRQWLNADVVTQTEVLLSVRLDEPVAAPLPALKDQSIYVELNYVDPTTPTLRIAWKLARTKAQHAGVSLAQAPQFRR